MCVRPSVRVCVCLLLPRDATHIAVLPQEIVRPSVRLPLEVL